MSGFTHTQSQFGGVDAPFYEYEIDYSCRFNDDDSAKAAFTLGAPTDNNKFTVSVWVKRCNITATMGILTGWDGGDEDRIILFNASDQLHIILDGGLNGNVNTTAVFRDCTNWYHIVVRIDLAQGVAADRGTIWVNNVEQAVTTTTAFANDAVIDGFTNGEGIELGHDKVAGAANYFDGYLAEFHFCDGQALTPSSFGTTKNGVWVPKKYTGVYGNNGAYLDFAVPPGTGNGAGTDVSGNGNHWTDSNLAANDQMTDTPTNNYPTLSNLFSSNNHTLSNGNLDLTTSVAAANMTLATMPIPKSGKWYWETKIIDANAEGMIGVMGINAPSQFKHRDASYLHNVGTDGHSYWASNGNYYSNGDQGAYGDAYLQNEYIGVAFNSDNGEVTMYNQGVSQGVMVTLTDVADVLMDYYPAWSDGAGAASSSYEVNFGQYAFTNAAPTGYLPLSTQNIAYKHAYSSDIMNPSQGFNTVLYTGNGGTQSITGVDHQPDLIWIKDRANAAAHVLMDSVRGVGGALFPDGSDVEDPVTDAVTSYDTDGFSLGDGTELSRGTCNTGARTYVAWCWKESVSYGFDIVSYTGTGAAHAENHNLGVVPELIIVKRRDNAVGSWWTYHKAALNSTDPETDAGWLDLSNVWTDDATGWNDTAPTSTQFTIGTATGVNANGSNFVAYLFRSVEGFSKVFTYEGNANADGPFIYCGFRPMFVMVKCADNAHSWAMIDGARDTYNSSSTLELYPDTNGVETAADNIDLLSNGIKVRFNNNRWNRLNNTYVGIAFAEMPGVYGNAK
jgi:hypothetical protein